MGKAEGTATDPAANTAAAEEDGTTTLRALWLLQAQGLLAMLQSGQPLKAAERAVVNRFLADNGVSRDTLERQGATAAMHSLAATLTDLPSFPEAPEGSR